MGADIIGSSTGQTTTVATSSESSPTQYNEYDGQPREKQPLSKRILGVIWDSLDKTPKERALIAKLDWWILSYVCVAYFVKYLDQTNVRTPSYTSHKY